MPSISLTPEAQAAIEQVLALLGSGYSYAIDNARTILSALLLPPEPNIEVTDEMAIELWSILEPEDQAPFWIDDAREHSKRLANSPLCPAAWLPAPPEDERTIEVAGPKLARMVMGWDGPMWRYRNPWSAWQQGEPPIKPPEDERVKELREAAAVYLDPGARGNRLRAALQAFEKENQE